MSAGGDTYDSLFLMTAKKKGQDTTMEIRKMTIEDYEAVYQLWFSTAGMGLRTLDDSREGLVKLLDRNPNTSFVATIEDEIVGVTLSGHDGRRGYIYHTAVRTSHRGQKIGKALLEAVYSAMKEEGINKMGLLIYKDNDNGNAFWTSQDWVQRTDLNYYDKNLNRENQ